MVKLPRQHLGALCVLMPATGLRKTTYEASVRILLANQIVGSIPGVTSEQREYAIDLIKEDPHFVEMLLSYSTGDDALKAAILGRVAPAGAPGSSLTAWR
jgi:hypothetical protein